MTSKIKLRDREKNMGLMRCLYSLSVIVHVHVWMHDVKLCEVKITVKNHNYYVHRNFDSL